MRGCRDALCSPLHARRFRRFIRRLAPWGAAALALLAPVAYAMAAAGDPAASESAVVANTGAARLRIPIEAPPGPGGFAPKLELSYSSLDGDGPFGVGWKLNLGEIRCTARFGVPNYSACPRYELDGQLLTADPENPNRYHTFVESFQKIQYFPSNEWVVRSTDGTIRRYGHTSNSRIQVGGDTARWLLSKMGDTFGNTVAISYDADPDANPDTDPDVGMAYPTVVSYASGKREIVFVYESRPDPIHDFAGGIEREITHRVKEIQVTSYGKVFQRLVLSYDDESYSTGRSRLAWAQRFGSDCPLSVSDPTQAPQCTGLPAQEFEYTDPSDVLSDGAGSQWIEDSTTWAPPATFESRYYWEYPTRNPYRLGDVNGDGLTDVVYAEGDSATGKVFLNTGSGWQEDTSWSAALNSLSFSAPRITATTVIGPEDPCTLACRFGFLGVCEASLSWVDQPVSFKGGRFEADDRPAIDASNGAYETQGSTESFVQLLGWFQLVDLNADGLADLVMSVRMSGVHESLNCDGTEIEDPEYFEHEGVPVEGVTVKVAFRNTGTGWEEDSALAAGLPLFGMVMAESPEYLPRVYYPYIEYAPCEHFALAGQEEDYYPIGGDFCTNTVSLVPTFTDLNGDGQLDLIVSEPEDETKLWVDNDYYGSYDSTSSSSHAWIRGGESWVRSPDFDPPLNHVYIAQEPALEYQGAILNPPPRSFMHDVGVRFVDFNRDGYTDVVWTNPFILDPDNPLSVGVLLNTGAGDGTPHSAWCSSRDLGADIDQCPHASIYEPPAGRRFAKQFPNGAGASDSLHLVDLNGDGWVDLLRADDEDEVDGSMEAWLHSRSADPVWVEDSRFRPPIGTSSLNEPSGVRLFDANGDGAVDFVEGVSVSGGTQSYRSFLSHSSLPDLLRESRNGRGGVAEFAYETAARQRDEALEDAAEQDAESHGEPVGPDPASPSTDGDVMGWTRRPVVSQVTVSGPNLWSVDPQGNPVGVTTSYQYAHPRRCSSHRSGLGFRLVRQTRPDGSVVEHFFYQKHGRAGRTSALLVKDGGSVVFWREEDWELPTHLIPGSLLDPEVFVGRLAELRSANEYDGEPGAESVRTLTYDDFHGYNFVSRIEVSRPTGDLRTVFVPRGPDIARWLVRLVAERRDEDPASGAVLSRSSFLYTPEGRIQSRTDDVQRRDGSGTLTTATTAFSYDGFGNLIQRTDANNHVTDFCYDGDADWCPSFAGQDSHSVLVGIRNPLEKVITRKPDEVTGVITQVASDYDDEPTVRRTLDPFGRVEEEYVTPLGGTEFLRSETIYHDYDVDPQPYTERRDYTASGFIRSAVVPDGFGGVWKTIEENASESADLYRGVAIYRDPVLGIVRQTYPIPCSEATCWGLVGGQETPATVTKADALGRPVRIDTPEGFSVIAYRFAQRNQPAGAGTGNRFDAVLTKNGKGDLSQRLLDGDRVVWVDECYETVAPSTESLASVSCDTADRTFYTYELTGQVSTVYDAVAVADGEFADPSHYLRYHYDTRGQVRQIDDPDGGTSFTEYDAVGNVASTTNAREQQATFGYDELDRLSSIDYPNGEEDVTITYRDGERQRERVAATSYDQTFDYDGLGRLERKTFDVGSHTMLLDFGYDELDRTTTIVYPDDQTVIQYEYEGAYLRRVCEVQSEDDDCGHDEALFYIQNVDYDHLGRREKVYTPAGDRTFAYDGSTYRVTQDRFAGASPENYTREVNYDLYDELGNILTVNATTSTGAVDFSASYTYDRRNRVESWTNSGVTEYFSYDSLGNLTGHGVPSATGTNQVFGHEDKPHAITESTATGSSYTYTYDADGNLASETDAGGTTYYLKFDSQNRLVCRGTTEGGCDRLEVDYDADGNRVRTRAYAVGWVEEVYAGELFQRNVASGGHVFHVFAFGEQIAFKKLEEGTLRTAPAGWPLPLRFDVPLPLAWGLLVAAGLGVGWLVLLRIGWAEAAHQEPVGAALCVLLAAAVALPPLPAGGGGGTPVQFRHWVISDHVGSSAVWLNKNGVPYRETVYTPFGRIREEDSSGMASPWIFAGHRKQTGGGGYVYMKARWYMRNTGTFMSVDPVVGDAADPQAFNGYSYAQNNPVNWIDPTGTTGCAAYIGICYFYVVSYSVTLNVGTVFYDSQETPVYAVVFSSTLKVSMTVSGVRSFGGFGGRGFGGIGSWGAPIGLPMGGGGGLVLTSANLSQSGGEHAGAEHTTYEGGHGDWVQGVEFVLWVTGARAIWKAGRAAVGVATAARVGRQAYVAEAQGIRRTGEKLVSEGVDPEAAARWAVDARNALKLEARQTLPRVFRWGAERWNIWRYGNPVGPSADALLATRTPQAVIESAGRTNSFLNWILGAQ